MRKSWKAAIAALLCAAGAAWGQITTTYDYTGQLYADDAVAPYTAGMRTSGWIRIAVTAPLPAAAGPFYLRDYMTDWSISDGVRTFTPANSAVMGHSHAYTNSDGSLGIEVLALIQPGGPDTIAHAIGDRVGSLHLWSSGQVNVRDNGLCSGVDPATNVCNSLTADADSINFASHGPDTEGWTLRAAPPLAATPVPTLGEWGLLLTGLLAAGLSARRLRRD